MNAKPISGNACNVCGRETIVADSRCDAARPLCTLAARLTVSTTFASTASSSTSTYTTQHCLPEMITSFVRSRPGPEHSAALYSDLIECSARALAATITVSRPQRIITQMTKIMTKDCEGTIFDLGCVHVRCMQNQIVILNRVNCHETWTFYVVSRSQHQGKADQFRLGRPSCCAARRA